MAQRLRDSKGRFVSGTSMAAFASRMHGYAQRLPENLNRNIIRLAADIERTVVLATPVDTGHARANWQVGINVSPTQELPVEDVGGAGTVAKAISVLEERKPEQTIYITNNVPYIQRLNDGWSAQAPAAFVEIAIDTAIKNFRTAKVIE